MPVSSSPRIKPSQPSQSARIPRRKVLDGLPPPKNFGVTAFAVLVCLTLLTPLLTFNSLLYPAVTSKALYFRILVELTFPLYVYVLLTNRSLRPSPKNPIVLGALAFLTVNVAAAIAGISPFRSFWGDLERMGGVFHLVHLVVFCFYVELVAKINAANQRRFIALMVIVGAMVAVCGVLVSLTNNQFIVRNDSYPRVAATLGNPIFLASALIIPFYLTVLLVSEARNALFRVIWGLAGLLEFWCILLTRTRGAFVALVAATEISLAVYLMMAANRKRRRLIIVLAGSLAFFAAIGLTHHDSLSGNSIFGRILNLRNAGTDARIHVWKASWRSLLANPLLGVGPENFYVVDSKYYDSASYAYDPSWFDKPHNEFLETAATVGFIGAASYLFLLGSSIWVAYVGIRRRVLTAEYGCIVIAAIVAYEIQNCFAFDTPAASVTHFALLGLLSAMWLKSKTTQDSPLQVAWPAKLRVAVVTASTGLGFVAVLTTICGFAFARNIYLGGSFGLSQRPEKAESYFDSARTLPVVPDPVELAGKYSEFAIKYALTGHDVEWKKTVLNDAIATEKGAIQRVPEHAPSWQRLAGLYVTQAQLMASLSPLENAEKAVRRAIQLAPSRPEPIMVLVRLKLYRNDAVSARLLLQEVLRKFPSDAEANMQAALLERAAGMSDDAARFAQIALSHGFVPQQGREIDWLVPYYIKCGYPVAALDILKIAIKAEPAHVDYYWQLGQLYYQIGNKKAALHAAQMTAFLDPGRAAEVSQFIKFLNIQE